MKYVIHNDDNIQALKQYPDNHFDSIVTDPPYGIEFLGKDWDKNTGAIETWQECLRVLKPGGYLLAFSAARTYHHLATNIEQVGFEIRDQLMWLYASGFPKAQDIGKGIQRRQGVEEYVEVFDDGSKSKSFDYGMKKSTTNKQIVPTSPEAQAWAGWKTSLKPAHEPIVMARKPFKGSTIDNVLKHGTGALNIDASRIETDEDYSSGVNKVEIAKAWSSEQDKKFIAEAFWQRHDQGRFPSNVMGEVEGYQKYFYCPKVSRKERHIGFEHAPSERSMLEELGGYYIDEDGNRTNQSKTCWIPGPGKIYIHGLKHEYEKIVGKENAGNNHPTVKPVALMKYLVQLVTPKGGIVLDPFTGSGATGMAAVELGNEFVGCELDPNYVSIAETRIEAWYEENKPNNNFDQLFDDNTK